MIAIAFATTVTIAQSFTLNDASHLKISNVCQMSKDCTPIKTIDMNAANDLKNRVLGCFLPLHSANIQNRSIIAVGRACTTMEMGLSDSVGVGSGGDTGNNMFRVPQSVSLKDMVTVAGER